MIDKNETRLITNEDDITSTDKFDLKDHKNNNVHSRNINKDEIKDKSSNIISIANFKSPNSTNSKGNDYLSNLRNLNLKTAIKNMNDLKKKINNKKTSFFNVNNKVENKKRSLLFENEKSMSSINMNESNIILKSKNELLDVFKRSKLPISTKNNHISNNLKDNKRLSSDFKMTHSNFNGLLNEKVIKSLNFNQNLKINDNKTKIPSIHISLAKNENSKNKDFSNNVIKEEIIQFDSSLSQNNFISNKSLIDILKHTKKNSLMNTPGTNKQINLSKKNLINLKNNQAFDIFELSLENEFNQLKERKQKRISTIKGDSMINQLKSMKLKKQSSDRIFYNDLSILNNSDINKEHDNNEFKRSKDRRLTHNFNQVSNKQHKNTNFKSEANGPSKNNLQSLLNQIRFSNYINKNNGNGKISSNQDLLESILINELKLSKIKSQNLDNKFKMSTNNLNEINKNKNKSNLDNKRLSLNENLRLNFNQKSDLNIEKRKSHFSNNNDMLNKLKNKFGINKVKTNEKIDLEDVVDDQESIFNFQNTSNSFNEKTHMEHKLENSKNDQFSNRFKVTNVKEINSLNLKNKGILKSHNSFKLLNKDNVVRKFEKKGTINYFNKAFNFRIDDVKIKEKFKIKENYKNDGIKIKNTKINTSDKRNVNNYSSSSSLAKKVDNVKIIKRKDSESSYYKSISEKSFNFLYKDKNNINDEDELGLFSLQLTKKIFNKIVGFSFIQDPIKFMIKDFYSFVNNNSKKLKWLTENSIYSNENQTRLLRQFIYFKNFPRCKSTKDKNRKLRLENATNLSKIDSLNNSFSYLTLVEGNIVKKIKQNYKKLDQILYIKKNTLGMHYKENFDNNYENNLLNEKVELDKEIFKSELGEKYNLNLKAKESLLLKSDEYFKNEYNIKDVSKPYNLSKKKLNWISMIKKNIRSTIKLDLLKENGNLNFLELKNQYYCEKENQFVIPSYIKEQYIPVNFLHFLYEDDYKLNKEKKSSKNYSNEIHKYLTHMNDNLIKINEINRLKKIEFFKSIKSKMRKKSLDLDFKSICYINAKIISEVKFSEDIFKFSTIDKDDNISKTTNSIIIEDNDIKKDIKIILTKNENNIDENKIPIIKKGFLRQKSISCNLLNFKNLKDKNVIKKESKKSFNKEKALKLKSIEMNSEHSSNDSFSIIKRKEKINNTDNLKKASKVESFLLNEEKKASASKNFKRYFNFLNSIKRSHNVKFRLKIYKYLKKMKMKNNRNNNISLLSSKRVKENIKNKKIRNVKFKLNSKTVVEEDNSFSKINKHKLLLNTNKNVNVIKNFNKFYENTNVENSNTSLINKGMFNKFVNSENENKTEIGILNNNKIFKNIFIYNHNQYSRRK